MTEQPTSSADGADCQWQVTIDGNDVILKMTCRDNYEAIMLGETIGAGIEEGHIELELTSNE